ncbi:metalloregulator ArsR/SmtB family transcription factor [Glaciecola sp.]|jgi:ArsR family transcriptional regulator|uniref:metalloregulator ArsR/SmtB family transcription factor n=1 Tax=Glaciecola sp. MF2-115 TaxID=3384827 RepID=UPI003989EDDB
MNPCTFFKCLADETRLKTLLLIVKAGEACVCDLMAALSLDQPKASRHLAQLRKCGILVDERRGKWVFYKLHPALPEWTKDVINNTAENNDDYYSSALQKLQASQSSSLSCC